MDQRDWELLDQQMRGSSPPRNDGILGLSVAAVFLAGLTLGSILFAHQSAPTQLARNNAKVATYFPNGSAPTISR
jgi:hypothetical protein